MERQHLTDELIGDLAFASNSESRYEIYDASIPNLCVRVGSKSKSFMVAARFRGRSGDSSMRTIGKFPAMTTEAARVEAHKWNRSVRRGIDPGAEVEAARQADVLRRRSTFASVMADYLAHIPSRKRNLRAEDDIKLIKRQILDPKTNSWMELPISEVTDAHVTALVQAIERRAPTQAFHVFTKLKTFFRWAMHPDRRDRIGLKHNPIEVLTATYLGLGVNDRVRVLDYEEVYAYLKAADATPYPYGPFAHSLISCGQRAGVVAAMRWSQINLNRKLWTIPGSRNRLAKPGRTSKMEDGLQIPLSDRMIQLLLSIKAQLPADHGDFVFSFTGGQTPIGNIGNMRTTKSGKEAEKADTSTKGKFERTMLSVLNEFGYVCDDPWVFHDVRRTVRTHLEPITGRREVAEAAIGHGKSGINRVYNLYLYRAEIRRGFNAWAILLEKIEQGTCTIADWEHDPEALEDGL
jgi:integrase